MVENGHKSGGLIFFCIIWSSDKRFLTSTELRLTLANFISKLTRKLIHKLYLNAQPIPAVYIPPATPGDSHILPAQSHGFSQKSPRGGMLMPGID